MSEVSLYGAEELERKYPSSALLSFAIAMVITLGTVLYPIIREALKEDKSEQIPVKVTRVVNYSELQAPPPIDLEKPPPEMTQAQPVVKTVKYLPPAPKKDEEVLEEEEIPTMEELDNTLIGTQDVEGLDSVVFEAPEVEIKSEPVEAEVFQFVEKMPQFDGGDQALFKYLNKNLKYPRQAKEADIQGMVIVSFVVEQDGSISNVEVLRSVHPQLDEEAIRVISSMPAWIPGQQNQQPVRVKFNLPVRFVLK